MNKWKNLTLTYLLNFSVSPLLYQSPSFVPYIITILSLLLIFPTCSNMFVCFFFWKKDKKRRCVCGSDDGKELEKCIKNFSFFFHMTECVFILTSCNINAISALNCNEQYKEGIDYDSNTLWDSNHSTSEHNINQDQ